MIEKAYREWRAVRAAIARTKISDDRILELYRDARVAVARLAALPIHTPAEARMVLEVACSAVDELPEPWLTALRSVLAFLDRPPKGRRRP